MSRRRYGVLGWIVWRVGTALVRRRVRQLRGRVAALLGLALVVALGVGAARAGAGR